MLIAQISDPHITLSGTLREDKYATVVQLKEAVDHILKLPTRPELVLVTGDCADNGEPEEYRLLQQCLAPLAMPVYLIPGNHDNRQNLRQTFGEQGSQHHAEFIQYVVETEPLRLLALDTLHEGQGGGQFCPQRLAWLRARLNESPEKPTILFQHHPPFLTGLSVLDGAGFEGLVAFHEILAGQPQIERVLAGHTHCHLLRRVGNSIAVTCPALSFQLQHPLSEAGPLWAQTGHGAILLHYWSTEIGLITYTYPLGQIAAPELVYDGAKWLM